ncbi:MAG: efflux RND transporter periplasmic adaptor subunit [Deltaproteobacteria bacterium]|nr:efflux RND transporter periplasmic adaptor subunit [Deltaproteobacteria bacterium]
MLVIALLSITGCAESREASAQKTDDAHGALVPSVQVTEPRREAISRTLTLPGSVEAFEKARLYAKVAGYLEKIHVDIGDRVTKGQVLAVLDIPEMAMEYAQAEAELAEAKAQHAKAQVDDALQKVVLERSKTLRAREAITQQQLDEAQARGEVAAAEVRLAQARIDNVQAHLGKLKTLMEYARIKAPFDGIVTERFVDPGALIQVATSTSNVSPLVTVQRVDMVRVFVAVPEPDVPAVDRGDPATLVLSALPEKKFAGTVTRFASALDSSTRTMKVEVDLPNPEGLLRPGMYGNLTLNLETRAEAFTLPATALLTEKGKVFVYVVEDGQARKVEVTTGIDNGIRVEITSGLQGHEEVIVAGANAVNNGGSVRAVRADDAATNSQPVAH